MVDPREEIRRQLEYIDRELAAGKHEYPGRATMLHERRAAIMEKLDKREAS